MNDDREEKVHPNQIVIDQGLGSFSFLRSRLQLAGKSKVGKAKRLAVRIEEDGEEKEN